MNWKNYSDAQMSEIDAINPGDVVQLKSVSEPATVGDINPTDSTAMVYWQTEGQNGVAFLSAELPLITLVKAEPSKDPSGRSCMSCGVDDSVEGVSWATSSLCAACFGSDPVGHKD